MPLTFLVNGREVDEAQFKAMAEKKKPRPVKEQAGYHKGFRVVGHAPGAIKRAFIEHERAMHEYHSTTQNRRAELGLKEPKPWSEDFWRRNTRKDSIRSRTYEIFEAAEQCAEMARKAGWEDVEIIELKKEVRNDSFMA